MSLEQLMDVEVTSVSRRPQKASEAAAAVFVLTQEDIRRAGVTSVPDALRLVPGVEVARISTNTWAISIRGFNSRFANKLLVMIDGRSVYTPLFSGVFWDRHDVLLEDIDRIEVIRGPGASLWGANAVNGVINIITRHTKDTQGTFARGTAGNVENGIAEVRHGGRIDTATYRLYAKGRLREAGETETGADAGDDWKVGLVGFRGDTEAGSDSFLLEGQYQWSEASERASIITLTPPFAETGNLVNDSNGGYLLGRWSRELSDVSSLSVQGYYDHRQFDDVRLSERRDTFDLQLQHNFSPLPRHEVVWGAGYRMIADEIDNTFSVSFDPESRTTHLFSSFVQDTFALVPNELDLVVGTKLEHNDFTGFEVQPNARLLWRPAARHTLWAAVSRAVRTPSRAENDVRLNSAAIPPGAPGNPSSLPAVVAFVGSSDAEAEKLIAYELGYRTNPLEWLSLDFTGFYNDYDDLRAVVRKPAFLERMPAFPHLTTPLVIDNAMTAEAFGFEAVANVQVQPWWRLQGNYSFLELDAEVPVGFDPTLASDVEGASPEQQATLRSMMDLRDDISLDAALRFVDALPAFDVGAYAALDLRVAWRPGDGLELALTGRNLLDPAHPEFGSEGLFPTQPTEAPRSIFFSVAARF